MPSGADVLPYPSSAPVAGLASIFVAAGALGLGYLVARVVLGQRSLDRVARWGLALPGLGLFVVVTMLLHMASGGRLLAGPWMTRGWVALAAGGLGALAWRRRGPEAPVPGWRLAAGLAGAAVLLWGTPVFRLLPLDFVGDTTWHAGWASQLLNGETTPAAVITGEIPNYYPWLFHAVAAFLARFTPGGSIFHALGPLQLVLVAGSTLTLFALGRELTGRWQTGGWMALLGGMAGGFGFFLLRGLDVVVEPRAERGLAAVRYAGDLLYKRSYNASFNNLSPPLPRDVALTMLIGFLLLLLLGLRRQSTPLLVASGVCLGMAGLAGGEAVMAGGGVAVLATVIPIGAAPGRMALTVLLPAATVYAIWLVPLAASYVRLGGFQNITDVGPVDLSPLNVLVAWGVATPLALLGARRWLRHLRADPGARIILYLLVTAGFLAFAAVGIPGRLGEAFATLGRRHRYWPLLHLGLAMLGACAMTDLIARLRARRQLATAAAGLIVALAIPSPLVASLALPSRIRQPPMLAASLRGDTGTLLNALRGPEGARCTLAVPHGGRQALVWSYTGHRLVLANWKLHHPFNRARIRWRDIYERIPGDFRRREANRLLTLGEAGAAAWRLTARRYGVDAVVVPAGAGARSVFEPFDREPVTDPLGPVTVVWLDRSCRPAR